MVERVRFLDCRVRSLDGALIPFTWPTGDVVKLRVRILCESFPAAIDMGEAVTAEDLSFSRVRRKRNINALALVWSGDPFPLARCPISGYRL